MTIEKLIAIADKGYSDRLIQEYFQDPKGEHGDTLAQFIAIELRETLDPDGEAIDQLLDAMEALEKAQAQIGGVIATLSAAYVAAYPQP